MNKSATLSRYETADYYYSNDFDYQTDFTQFLEEARKNEHYETSTTTPRLEAAGDEHFVKEGKNRKSWRTSLLRWLKTDKKGRPEELPTNSKTISKPIRSRHVSGPIHGIAGGREARGAKSGPLTRLFSSTRDAGQYEVSYMCLDNPQKLTSYGPVYLVT